MRKFILQNKEFTEMNLTTVREIYRSRETYLDKEVQIGGWVRSVRGSKNFGFIVVSDGSYFETLQVVYHDTEKMAGGLFWDRCLKRLTVWLPGKWDTLCVDRHMI